MLEGVTATRAPELTPGWVLGEGGGMGRVKEATWSCLFLEPYLEGGGAEAPGVDTWPTPP